MKSWLLGVAALGVAALVVPAGGSAQVEGAYRIPDGDTPALREATSSTVEVRTWQWSIVAGTTHDAVISATTSGPGVVTAWYTDLTRSKRAPAAPPWRDAWLAADHMPSGIQSASTGMAGWKRGLLWGGLVGTGLGIIAYVLVDAVPCDSCSGTGADSSADGAFLEFAIGFGLGGAVLGALIGAL